MQESPSHTIDIVAFIPDKAIDPIFYDKAYYLAPDKRGGKPYNLLIQAMRESGRVALAQVGVEGASSTSSRCARPKTAWSCSSCSTPTKCAR